MQADCETRCMNCGSVAIMEQSGAYFRCASCGRVLVASGRDIPLYTD